MYRHQQLIRMAHVEPYYGNPRARRLAAGNGTPSCVHNRRPVDIVNAMLANYSADGFELPAYSTLDRLADRAHAAADRRLFGWVMRHIPDELRTRLGDLLVSSRASGYRRFQAVINIGRRTATLSHLEELLSHLNGLNHIGADGSGLKGISPTKIRSFARRRRPSISPN